MSSSCTARMFEGSPTVLLLNENSIPILNRDAFPQEWQAADLGERLTNLNIVTEIVSKPTEHCTKVIDPMSGRYLREVRADPS